MDNRSASNGGSFFLSLLAVLFIGLKLTGFISWSWWWVLAPLWGPFSFALIVLFLVWIFGGFK